MALRNSHIRLPLLAFVHLLLLATSCDEPTRQNQQPREAKKAQTPQVDLAAALIENMPMNSDNRCFGISTVVEALLDGKPVDDAEAQSLNGLAKSVFDNLVSDSQISYSRHVKIENRSVPVQSPRALELLGALVSDLHKQVGAELTPSPEFEEQYLLSFVRTRKELDARLEADADKTVAFCGVGIRIFPDGSEQDSDHVFLIKKQHSGELAVYDSNAPGAPIRCQTIETEDFLEVEWTCTYQNTGQTTTQAYSVLDVASFSKLAAGQESAVAERPAADDD